MRALTNNLAKADLPSTVEVVEGYLGQVDTQWYVDGIAGLVDEPQQATPTIAEINGRPATTFAEWATQSVDIFQPERTSLRH